MSNVAHGAFALTPSESNFERLTKRLLALRAEIDAILAELAGQAMAMQRAQATAAPPAQELSPVLSDPLTGGTSMRKGHGMVEDAEAASKPRAGRDATGELLEPSAIVGFAAPEQPIADATGQESPEVEQNTRDHSQPISNDLTPIVAIDFEHSGATGLCPEAELASTANKSAATEAAAAEQTDDAAILEAARHSSAESTQLVDTGISAADRAPIGDSPATPAAAPAEAAVINFHTRQKKQKGELAIRAARPVRSSRHLAAKIAACILVLLTAASILVMADRTAMGGVQSFPWMSPMPLSPAATDRTLQRDQIGVAEALDDAAAIEDLPPLSDGILMRYRATWPSGS
jgi:hypothetical protein